MVKLRMPKLSIAGLLKKRKQRRNDEARETSTVTAREAGQSSMVTTGAQSDATATGATDEIEVVEPSTGTTGEQYDATAATVRTYTYRELRDATRGFSFRRRSKEKSNSGSVFRGTLDNTQVSVKRLNSGRYRNTDYELEVKDLSRLSHPNIIKMIGTCVEGPKRFIVYQYSGGTTLHDCILGRKIGQRALDWTTRMKIATGIANGLRYLHHEVSPPVIHGDLRLYNILLGNGFEPKISDFGNPKDIIMSNKSDVLSFGVLLVEIVTGKTARDWSRQRPEHLEEWLGQRLGKEKKLRKLKDRKLKGRVPDQHTLQKVMTLASRCVKHSHDHRPDMKSVARAMNHFISEPNAAAWPWPWEFSENEDDDYSQDCPQIFFFREISGATKKENRIGSGSHGMSFKGELYNRTVMIIVQSPHIIISGNKQLFPKIDLLRLRHPNVANLIGYCFEENKHYLVYEFMTMGSLSDALECVKPLDWATRMKIAAGVAKGLNHLHGERGVVCRNLQPCNIYIDQGWNPKICALEFAQYISPPKICLAPESNDNDVFTYKTDMYSFGLLLLEIIAGRRARDIMDGDMEAIRKEIRDNHGSVLADPKLKGKFPEEMFVEAIRLASQCLDVNPALRPEMIDVMKSMNELSPDPDLRALPVKPSVKGGESSQPARSLINNAGAQLTSTLAADVISRVEEASRPIIQRLEEACNQLTSTLAADVISRVEEAFRPIIQRLEEACNHAVGARSSGTIVTQARATGNKYILFSYSQIDWAKVKYISTGKSSDVGKMTLFNQPVAIKRLKTTERKNNYDREVRLLSHLSHPNIINLIGCCAHEEERIIVYEFMPLGNLSDHLHDRESGQALDWDTRMKIALGIAEGLSYLHYRADPQVIYKDLKSSKILLGDGYHPKISGFITAEYAPFDDQSTVTAVITAYRAPEYLLHGGITSKLDVFSFGVILLELIMGGRMPVVTPKTRQCYVDMDKVMGEKDVHNLADPEMKGEFREDMFKRALTVALICTQFHPDSRPDMRVVVRAMNYLTSDHASDWPAEFNTVAESSSAASQCRRKSF